MNYKKDYYKIAAKKYIDSGFNMKKAIIELHPGIKEKTAEVRGTRMLRNVKFRQELSTILEGIDEETLNLRLRELLNAKVITEYKGKARLTDLPNYSERRKALNIIFELLDLYPAKKIDERSVSMNIYAQLEQMNKEEVMELVKEMYKKEGYEVIFKKL